MKTSSVLLVLIGIVIGVLVTISVVGCHNEIHYVYDSSLDELVASVKPGDTLMWPMKVEWSSGDSGPCESGEFSSSGGTRCTIASTAKKTTHNYNCDGTAPCDPDVVVDDQYPIRVTRTATVNPAAVAPAALRAANPRIILECASNTLNIKPWEKNDRSEGETVVFKSYGNNELKNWKVTLEGADAGKFCKDGKTEFTSAPDNDVCELARTSGTSIEYGLTYTDCGTPSARKGKVTVE